MSPLLSLLSWRPKGWSRHCRTQRNRPGRRLTLEPLEDRIVPTGWAFNINDPGRGEGTAVATDAAGNVYVAGDFSGTTDFDPTPSGTATLTGTGFSEMYLAKYSPTGALEWARRVGGDGIDFAFEVAVDAVGNVYLSGRIDSRQFDVTGTGGYAGPSWTQVWLPPNQNTLHSEGLVAKFNPDGTVLWARQFGGPGDIWSSRNNDGLAIGPDGSVYLTGDMANGTVDFDPTAAHPGNTDLLTSADLGDVYVARYAGTDGSFLWARRAGGIAEDQGEAIAVDAFGNAYVSGQFGLRGSSGTTADFDLNNSYADNRDIVLSAGDADAFVTKLDIAGNFLWVRRAGGSSYDNLRGIQVYGESVYSAGYFSGASADFGNLALDGVGAVSLTSHGDRDIVVSKLTTDGQFLWTRQLGGQGYDVADGLAVDAAGNVYTTGSFLGVGDFDPGPNTVLLSGASANKWDVFVSKLDADGNYAWARSMGGPGTDVLGNGGYNVAVDASGFVYTVGYFSGTFTADTGGTAMVTFTAVVMNDTFVVKMDQNFQTRRDTYPTSGPAVAIPDLGTVLSSIVVTGGTTSILDVNVRIDVTHAKNSDLDIFLIAPDGTTRIELTTDNGGAGKHYTRTTFDDQAGVAVTAGSAPYPNTYRPEQPLNVLAGTNANGTWQLQVTDDTKRNTGTLVSWSLIITGTLGSPLQAASVRDGLASDQEFLDAAALKPIMHEAIARWKATGLSVEHVERLRGIDLRIADLGGVYLGLASGNTIWLDDNAAGWGWFVDPTPGDDREFSRRGNQGEQGHMDLLTVLAHELGHVLGLEHVEDGVMAETLAAGTRQLPGAQDAAAGLVGRSWLTDGDMVSVALALTRKSSGGR